MITKKNNQTLYSKGYLLTLLLLQLCSLSFAQVESIKQGISEQIKLVEQCLSPPAKDSSDVRWSIEERMKFYHIPAVSIAVIEDFEVKWAKAYGWADREEKIQATTETLFQAASISKSVHAIGFLHWVEKNNIDLDIDFANFLSTWDLPSRKRTLGKDITLANLLSHTGGLSGHGFSGYKQGKSIPSTIQVLQGKRPSNSRRIVSRQEPNTTYKYSGGGITVTQLILEENTSLPYAQYMQKNVLDKLNMKHSSFQQPPSSNKQLATAHTILGGAVKGKYHIYPEQAAAGLWTNPTDLGYFIIEVQKSLLCESNTLLSQDLTKRMTSPHLVDGNTGLGVFIETINDKKYFSHGGSNRGFKCLYYGSLEDGKGLVVMINSDNFDIIPEILRSVIHVHDW